MGVTFRPRNESRASIINSILHKKGPRLILGLEEAESRDSVSDSPGVHYLAGWYDQRVLEALGSLVGRGGMTRCVQQCGSSQGRRSGRRSWGRGSRGKRGAELGRRQSGAYGLKDGQC